MARRYRGLDSHDLAILKTDDAGEKLKAPLHPPFLSLQVHFGYLKLPIIPEITFEDINIKQAFLLQGKNKYIIM